MVPFTSCRHDPSSAVALQPFTSSRRLAFPHTAGALLFATRVLVLRGETVLGCLSASPSTPPTFFSYGPSVFRRPWRRNSHFFPPPPSIPHTAGAFRLLPGCWVSCGAGSGLPCLPRHSRRHSLLLQLLSLQRPGRVAAFYFLLPPCIPAHRWCSLLRHQGAGSPRGNCARLPICVAVHAANLLFLRPLRLPSAVAPQLSLLSAASLHSAHRWCFPSATRVLSVVWGGQRAAVLTSSFTPSFSSLTASPVVQTPGSCTPQIFSHPFSCPHIAGLYYFRHQGAGSRIWRMLFNSSLGQLALPLSPDRLTVAFSCWRARADRISRDAGRPRLINSCCRSRLIA